MNKIVNIEVNVDELGTMDNLNGLLTFNLHYSPHLQPAQPKWFTHTTPQYNKTKRIF